MNKLIQNLNLNDDFLFAKVMSDKEICQKVLEKILKIQIKEIKMPTEQKVIDLVLESKSVRLDIYVSDESNTVYNVEMQKIKHKNLAKRSRYYQGNIDLDMIQRGEDYDKLHKSFVIFICTFDPFNQGRHLYTFENRCIEDTKLLLGDDTQKVFLNTRGKLNDVDEEMLELLTYIENSTDAFANHSKSELVKFINQKVNHLKSDKSLEVEYMTLYEREKEKFLEGVEANKLANAKALLDILDDETIASKIELPLETVQKLRTEILSQ